MNDKLKTYRTAAAGCGWRHDDGRIIWDANGTEIKFFNVKDGHGIKLVQRAVSRSASSRDASLRWLVLRAKELGIEILYQGSLRKQESYDEIKRRTGWTDIRLPIWVTM